MKNAKKLRTVLFLLGIIAMVSSCRKDSFEAAQPITDVQTAVDCDQQDVQGTSGNGIRELGCNLLSPVDYNKLPKAPEMAAPQSGLPSKFTLPCPAMKTQGGEGSCVAWGVAYEAMSIAVKKSSGGSWNYWYVVFSPEFVFNQIKIGSSCLNGAYIPDALDLLKTTGVCSWCLMPYSDSNGCLTMPDSTQLANASLHKISSYNTVTKTASNFKNLLYAGHPVIVGANVDHDFYYFSGGSIYSSYDVSKYVGRHCYTIVGYDNTKSAFKIMNSWGTTWGDSGFAWVSYSLVTTLFPEAYIINL